VSRPFLVDNTAPVITGLVSSLLSPASSLLCRVSFSAQDALSPIAAARVSVNAGDWVTLEPQDHVFDSGTESFSADVKLAPGGNVVSVWVADAQGNVGAARTSIRLRQ
jgi:hypothetical protein